MRRLRAPLAALAALTALGACTGDPEPRFADPTPEPTPTSPAPTSDPPSSSATTGEPSPEPQVLSPEETVRAWVEARNELMKTGDPQAVRALSSPGCRGCEELIDGIPEIYEAGGWIRTEGWRVSGAKRKPDFSTSFEVATGLVFASGDVKETGDSTPEPFEEQRNFLDFTLVRDGSGWLVGQVVFVR